MTTYQAEIIHEDGSGPAAAVRWQRILDVTDDELRQRVAVLVGLHGETLARRFYSTMMADPEAGGFLARGLVEQRLAQAMQRWLVDLFTMSDAEALSAAVARQRHVGEVHARIKLPISLVSRGARNFKHWLWAYLAQDQSLGRDRLLQAVLYVNDLLDLAIEIMDTAFMRNADRSARTEEAYRLFSLSQDLAIERERQRAALLEWGQQAMYAVHRRPLGQIPRIGNSEFGLWLFHKALFMFEGSPEIEQITVIMERVDQQIIPQLLPTLDLAQVSALLTALESEISHIKFLLSTLFDRYMEVENGRDVLTRLFNRRFLPSALMREMELAKRTNQNFALMLIDIDHFKQVNDVYGHDAGDVVLQQTAALIMNTVRSSDFVFRYGGEEILVILVNVDTNAAMAIAETLRSAVEKSTFLLSGGRSMQMDMTLTVSIGLAVYDRHPDYQFLISRADQALYEAKNTGRNRCVLAS